MKFALPTTLPRFAEVITGGEIFRIASLFLYVTLLAHVALALRAGELAVADMGTAALAGTALLAAAALIRYLRPDQLALTPGRIALELAGVIGVVAVIAVLGQHKAAPVLPLPWLVAAAGLFPLALRFYPALAAVLVVALADAALNLAMGISAGSGAPSVFAVLLIGLLSIFLSMSLRMNLAAVLQARTNDRRFNAIARATRHVFMIADAGFRVKYVNPAVQDVLGFAPEEMENDRILPAIHPDDAEQHEQKLRYLRQRSGSRIFSRHRARHKDGHWVWLETRGYNMLHDKAIAGLVLSIEDISARKEAESRLEQEHALLRAVLDLNPSMIYAKDTEGRFTVSNASFQRRFGYATQEELQGKTTYEVFQSQTMQGQDPESYRMADLLHQRDMQVIRSGEPLEESEIQGFWGNDSMRWYRTNSYPLQDAAGATLGALGITRDITERKQYEMRLEHQALHDPLTGLPNRRFLLDKISAAIARPANDRAPLTMLFCDLDFFKNVNDTHGHEIGDRCLLELTRRISTGLPLPAFIARLGGDEFVILAEASAEQAAPLAAVLLKTLSMPIEIDDVIVKIQASIGIAQMTDEHKTPSELLRDADAAMYQAKERGRNRSELFDASLRISTTRRARMDVALRFALERGELELAYQPKVAIADGALTGFEVLLRWNSPQYGYIAPDEFIPIAEHSGQLVSIGMWTLEQACRQLAAWKKSFRQTSGLTLAVNVSMRQLLQSAFVQEVAAILQKTGVAPGAIELELTETSAMANPRQTIETLSRLKDLGLRLALDDFGTGYSSLAYLQRLPIDVLKIDKAFVLGLGRNKGDAEIVRLILALARTLSLDTVAEGVESSQQLEELRRLGCQVAQGYLFSAAVPAAAAGQLLVGSRLMPLQRRSG